MKSGAVEQRFTAALAALIEQITGDRSMFAAILCGSLSHDTVWEKSDVEAIAACTTPHTGRFLKSDLRP